MNLLKQIFSFLPEGHQEAIRDVMSVLRKNSELSTDREIQFEAQRLVDRIKGKERVLGPSRAEPGTPIDSGQHNENIEGAYIDLKTLYKELDHIGNVQAKQTVAIESEFNKAKAAIFKLINDARIFAIRNRHPEFDDIKLVNFNIARNESTFAPTASIDQESRLLKLPEILKVRNHLARRGTKTTQITVEIEATGQQGHLSRQFDPSLAADGKTETFWADVILADIPIQSTYKRWGFSAAAPEIEETVYGPIARLNINFGGAEPVNQVKILPFAPHPVKILEISYRPTASSLIRLPIQDFEQEESLDWIEFNFEAVFAADIEVVFVQESYRDFIIHAPKHVLFATDFLVRLLDERARTLGEVPDIKDLDIGGNHDLYQEAIGDLSELMSKKDLDKSPSTEVDLVGKTVLAISEAISTFSPELQGLLQEVTTYTDQLPENLVDEIETFNKYEYIIGAREIQANYIVYAPSANYESEKFLPSATVANVQLQVDEKHPKVIGDYGPETQTSTEWSIEFAEDRRVPIFPTNFVDNGFLRVSGEYLAIDPVTKVGLSRLPSHMSFVLVKENDRLLIANVDYSVVWDSTFNGRLQITISEDEFDKNKVYTIEYLAAPESKEIDVLGKFGPKRIPKPEGFEGTDADQKVVTKYFPTINYGIINSESFNKNADGTFRYTSPTGAYSTGLAEIHPLWVVSGGVLAPITGTKTATAATGAGYGDARWNNLREEYLVDPFSYYLRLNALPSIPFEIDELIDADNFTLKTQPVLNTGLINSIIDSQFFFGNLLQDYSPSYGGTLTGFLKMPYTIDVLYKDGDELFGYTNLNYEPISVEVGGQQATNITNYKDVEQIAFTVSDSSDNEFEFIHDGNTLYFNQAVPKTTEVLVNYKWITKYVKVICKLRSNKVVNPTITPQVNEYRIMLNTTIL
jgi:hypothetical protein